MTKTTQPKWPERRKLSNEQPRDYHQYDKGYNHALADCMDTFNQWLNENERNKWTTAFKELKEKDK